MAKLFQTASLLCLAVTTLTAGVLWVTHKQKNLLKIITAGIYLALLCLFIPHFYMKTQGKDLGYVTTSSIYGSLRVFLLEQDYGLILELAAESQLSPGQWYVNYISILFAIAPLLTFSNVLSLFRNTADRLRFVTRLGGTMYVLSELNPHSLTMAESIRKELPHALIVFTDVGRKNAAELKDRARELNAVCISEDVAHLRFWNNFQRKRIFLISEDEAENVANGIALTQRYKESWQKMAIYVYASMPGSNEAIDSLEKGARVLNRKFYEYLEDLKEITEENKKTLKKVQMEGNFSIRCIDPVEQTVLKLLQDNYLTVHCAAKAEKRISVTVLGFGNFGSSFLKTAAWIFQLYGYQVEFNVFDADEAVDSRFAQQAPELAENLIREQDDAQHNIRFFAGVDCLSDEFDRKILKTDRERLARTQLILVALGDDSKNIAAAIRVRELFLRMQIGSAIENVNLRALSEQERETEIEALAKQVPDGNELPLICAVVTDEKRAANLDPQPKTAPGCGLMASNGHAYHIRAVGIWTDIYSYDRVKEIMEDEKAAFACHIGWVLQDYKKKKDINKDAEQVRIKNLTEQAQKYVNISYFRNSSVATRIHQQCMEKIEEDLQTEHGGRLEQVKNITEHMRWNAYMRGRGYRYSPVRNDRAKLHNDLIPYSQLSKSVQEIDSAVREKEVQNV